MKKMPEVHILNITEFATRRLGLLSRRAGVGLLAAMLLLPNISFAVDTVCAKVNNQNSLVNH